MDTSEIKNCNSVYLNDEYYLDINKLGEKIKIETQVKSSLVTLVCCSVILFSCLCILYLNYDPIECYNAYGMYIPSCIPRSGWTGINISLLFSTILVILSVATSVYSYYTLKDKTSNIKEYGRPCKNKKGEVLK